MISLTLGTFKRKTLIDFSVAQRIWLSIFGCHTVTHGTDLRRLPHILVFFYHTYWCYSLMLVRQVELVFRLRGFSKRLGHECWHLYISILIDLAYWCYSFVLVCQVKPVVGPYWPSVWMECGWLGVCWGGYEFGLPSRLQDYSTGLGRDESL